MIILYLDVLVKLFVDLVATAAEYANGFFDLLGFGFVIVQHLFGTLDSVVITLMAQEIVTVKVYGPAILIP
jgi:hypothetical protein